MDPWTDPEPGWKDVKLQLSAMVRRARRRWVLTLSLAALAGAAALSVRLLVPHHFESSIVVLVTEQGTQEEAFLPKAGKLKSQIWLGALNNSALMSIMNEFDLYDSVRELSPPLALEAMRDDIGLEVVQDSESLLGPERREPSARLVVSYQALDADLALRVVRALGDAVKQRHTQGRQVLITQAKDSLYATLGETRAKLDQARANLALLEHQYGLADSVGQAVMAAKVKQASRTVSALEEQASMLQSGAWELQVRHDLDDQQVGLRFELIDAGTLAPPPALSERQELSLLGVVGFLLGLPFAVVVAGLFDLAVRDTHGLSWIGLSAFGSIPSFPGKNVGSLAARLKG